jgi:hypothetical protein
MAPSAAAAEALEEKKLLDAPDDRLVGVEERNAGDGARLPAPTAAKGFPPAENAVVVEEPGVAPLDDVGVAAPATKAFVASKRSNDVLARGIFTFGKAPAEADAAEAFATVAKGGRPEPLPDSTAGEFVPVVLAEPAPLVAFNSLFSRTTSSYRLSTDSKASSSALISSFNRMVVSDDSASPETWAELLVFSIVLALELISAVN